VSSFQIVGDCLVGPGLSIEVTALVDPQQAEARKKILDGIVDIANVVHRAGRTSVLPSWDDRFDLHNAVESLRALAVIAGPFQGDRHRHAADIIARLLEELARC
jgi:hypothetical protein